MSAAIVVPLDGSAFAEQALPVARALATQLDAPLHLVSVYVPLVAQESVAGGPVYDRSYDEEQRDRNADFLRTRAGGLAPKVPAGVTYSAIEAGNVAEAILAEAGRIDARMIVTATHGRGGFQRVWLGSVADALVRAATIPLLLVRPELPDASPPVAEPLPLDVSDAPPHQAFRRLLLPLDGAPLAEEAIEPALAILSPQGSSIRLLRVVNVPATRMDPEQTFWTPVEREAIEDRRAEAVAYLEDASRNLLPSTVDITQSVILHASPAAAILEEAERWGADLIAMSTHAREGFKRLMVGSVADKVYRGASTPTLVVPPSR